MDALCFSGEHLLDILLQKLSHFCLLICLFSLSNIKYFDFDLFLQLFLAIHQGFSFSDSCIWMDSAVSCSGELILIPISNLVSKYGFIGDGMI